MRVFLEKRVVTFANDVIVYFKTSRLLRRFGPWFISICQCDRLGVFTVKVMGTGWVVLARDVRSDRTGFEWGFT